MTDVCLTLSLLMVTVASATLRATGVQSSLLEEPTIKSSTDWTKFSALFLLKMLFLHGDGTLIQTFL